MSACTVRVHLLCVFRILPMIYLGGLSSWRCLRAASGSIPTSSIQELPKLSTEDLVSGNILHQYLTFATDFERYLQGGGNLFLLQPGPGYEQFRNILSTICTRDIPLVHKNLSIEELGKLEQVITFIGKSPTEGISYSSISRNVGVTKYKAEQYISLLEKAFLVYRNFPGGTNVLNEPKVFMELPCRLLYR